MKYVVLISTIAIILAAIGGLFWFGHMNAQRSFEFGQEIESIIGESDLPETVAESGFSVQVSAWEEEYDKAMNFSQTELPPSPVGTEDLSSKLVSYPQMVSDGLSEMRFLAFTEKVEKQILDPTILAASPADLDLIVEKVQEIMAESEDSTGAVSADFEAEVNQLSAQFDEFVDELQSAYREQRVGGELTETAQEAKEMIGDLREKVRVSVSTKQAEINEIHDQVNEVQAFEFKWLN